MFHCFGFSIQSTTFNQFALTIRNVIFSFQRCSVLVGNSMCDFVFHRFVLHIWSLVFIVFPQWENLVRMNIVLHHVKNISGIFMTTMTFLITS